MAFSPRGVALLATIGAMGGCATLSEPFRLHEISAIQDTLSASAKAASVHDWEAFAETFDQDSVARRAMERYSKEIGVGPASVTLSQLRVETLEGEHATARAFVVVEPIAEGEAALAAWVEFHLVQREGRWLISEVDSPTIHRWKRLCIP